MKKPKRKPRFRVGQVVAKWIGGERMGHVQISNTFVDDDTFICSDGVVRHAHDLREQTQR